MLIFKIPKWSQMAKKWVSIEIALLNRVTPHPNIIPLLEWFDETDEFVLIFDRPGKHMDFFGESLFLLKHIENGFVIDFISDKGQLSEAKSLHYFKQITSAVSHCHR